ncbi:MAG: tetratricopeptide repeat protein [Gemmatimonadales bacterium]
MATVLCAVSPAAEAQRSREPSLEELERRAAADSNDATIHYRLALAHWKRKHWDDPERSLRVAVDLAPQYAEAWLALAVLPDMRGASYWRRIRDRQGAGAVDSAFSESDRYFRRAFLNNPLVDLAILGRFRGKPLLADERDRPILVFWWMAEFEKAENDLREARYARALERFSHILAQPRSGPDYSGLPDVILFHHGLAAARLGQFDLAIRDFGLLTGRAKADEEHASIYAMPFRTNDYRYVLATMYYLSGRFQHAAATFRRVLEFDVGVYQAHIQLARMYESSGMLAQAREEWEAATQVNPEDPQLLVDYGGLLARAGLLKEAGEVLAEAVHRQPRNAVAAFALGNNALQRGDSAQAREALRHFLAVAPSTLASFRAEAERKLLGLEH